MVEVASRRSPVPGVADEHDAKHRQQTMAHAVRIIKEQVLFAASPSLSLPICFSTTTPLSSHLEPQRQLGRYGPRSAPPKLADNPPKQPDKRNDDDGYEHVYAAAASSTAATAARLILTLDKHLHRRCLGDAARYVVSQPHGSLPSRHRFSTRAALIKD